MTVRNLILALAAACLLSASVQVTAQAPPAPADTEQRLKAIEDKMDRVLKLLEAKEPRPAEGDRRAALTASRDKLRTELAAKEKQYQEFRLKSPILFTRNAQGTTIPIADRLGKYESRRAELTVKMREMADQLTRIERTYKENGSRAALPIIRGLGLKINDATAAPDFGKQSQAIALLKAHQQKLVAAFGDKNAAVLDAQNAVALAKKTFDAANQLIDEKAVLQYISTVKEEILALSQKVETLTNLIEAEQKNAREMHAYEVTEERLRTNVEQLRKRLAEVENQMAVPATPSK